METPNNLQQSREDALTSSQPLQRKSPVGPFAVFIVADDKEQDKRRAEALAAAFRYILSDAWGKA
jgi:hypothetical protein